MTMGAFVLLFSLPIVYRYLIISRSGISTPYSKGAVDSIHLLLNPEMQQFSIGWMSRTNISLVSLGLMFLTLIFLKKDQNQYKLLVIEALLIIMCTNLFRSSPKCWCKLNSANLSFHKLKHTGFF